MFQLCGRGGVRFELTVELEIIELGALMQKLESLNPINLGNVYLRGLRSEVVSRKKVSTTTR